MKKHSFEEFCAVVEKLRSETGCPWDRAQTMDSLKPCMINEMTEAVAAIDLYHKTGNPENLCEELGDVLLQIVMLAQIAAESEVFGMDDVIHGVAEKMIRRHPHVFGDNKGIVEKEEVPGRWEEIKRKEKKDRTEEQKQQEKEAFADAAEQVIRHLSSR